MSVRAPPAQLVNAYPEFYRWLVPRLNALMSEYPDAQPTSWFRSQSRNLSVGGAARSQHLLAWAADFSLPRDRHAALIADARLLGLVAIDEGDHIHVQMFPAGVIPARFFPRQFRV